MHSWHTGLSARIVPNCLAPEKLEFGRPAISPCASISSGIGGGPPRPPPPPPPAASGHRNHLLLAILADGVEMLEAETDGIHQPMARRAGRVLDVLDHQLPAPLRLLIDQRIGQRRDDAWRRRRHVLAEQPLANEDAARRRRRVGRPRRRRQERALAENPGAIRVAPETSPSRTAPSARARRTPRQAPTSGSCSPPSALP